MVLSHYPKGLGIRTLQGEPGGSRCALADAEVMKADENGGKEAEGGGSQGGGGGNWEQVQRK